MDDTHAQGTGNAGSPVNGSRMAKRWKQAAASCGCRSLATRHCRCPAHGYRPLSLLRRLLLGADAATVHGWRDEPVLGCGTRRPGACQKVLPHQRATTLFCRSWLWWDWSGPAWVVFALFALAVVTKV